MESRTDSELTCIMQLWYDSLARLTRNAKPSRSSPSLLWPFVSRIPVLRRLRGEGGSASSQVPESCVRRNSAMPKINFAQINPLHDNTGVAGNTGPELGSLLTDGAGDGRALHLTLGVDDDTSVVLEIEEDTIEALPGLGLADDDGGVNFLAELGLSLLDGGHDHVTNTTSGQSVETGTDTLDGDDVKVASTRVVGAVHDGTNGKTEGHLKLATRGTAAGCTLSAKIFERSDFALA